MTTSVWLIDKSALIRLPTSPAHEEWYQRIEYLTPAIEARAMTVQALLAERGLRRAPSVPDLSIAANAELTGATVLHADKDFDLIASVTGQSVENLESFSG